MLVPSSYWDIFLKLKVKELALQQGPATGDAEYTKVVVSVGPRAKPPLRNEFKNSDIDWPIIERKLVAWGNLYDENHEAYSQRGVKLGISRRLVRRGDIKIWAKLYKQELMESLLEECSGSRSPTSRCDEKVCGNEISVGIWIAQIITIVSIFDCANWSVLA